MNYLRVQWDRAACRGWNTDMFFLEEGHLAAQVTPTLRDVCGECPILADCFEYAVNDPSVHGFWAGMTAKEREQYRTRRRKKEWRERRAS